MPRFRSALTGFARNLATRAATVAVGMDRATLFRAARHLFGPDAYAKSSVGRRSTRQQEFRVSEVEVVDGDYCQVVAGTHAGKSGVVEDKKVSKTGHLTITVRPENGIRFKTLARNVEKRTN